MDFLPVRIAVVTPSIPVTALLLRYVRLISRNTKVAASIAEISIEFATAAGPAGIRSAVIKEYAVRVLLQQAGAATEQLRHAAAVVHGAPVRAAAAAEVPLVPTAQSLLQAKNAGVTMQAHRVGR
jgi:hypothetical protein